METMFETYGVGGAYIQVQAGLTLYAPGLLTGASHAARRGAALTRLAQAALWTAATA